MRKTLIKFELTENTVPNLFIDYSKNAFCFTFDEKTRESLFTCTNDKPFQRGGAVPFPALGRVEMTCQFHEGLILGQFSFGQLFSFFIPAVQCMVTYGQHS